MRVLYDHPAKVLWKLNRVTKPGGMPYFMTGCYGSARNAQAWHPVTQLREGGAVVEQVPNVVVEARLRVRDWGRGRSAVTYTLEDADGGATYECGGRAVLDVLVALQEGRLRIEGGLICGRFTFSKSGQEVYLQPHVGPEARASAAAEAEAAGAPDLSDLVAALPRPRSAG